MANTLFQIHPSQALHQLYKMKNYQGANPNDADFIFVGRDPNWAIDIETMPFFSLINEYLNDGIAFWNKYKIHHPFLFSEYKGDGKRYHTMFSKLRLPLTFAHKISFVELIGFPTTGMAKKSNRLFQNYLLSDTNRNHLIQLEIQLNNPKKRIFIAWGLIDDFKFINRETGLFDKFANLDKSKLDINGLSQSENIFVHKHFSDSISNKTIEKISEKVNTYCE